jgi:hypothetical protein
VASAPADGATVVPSSNASLSRRHAAARLLERDQSAHRELLGEVENDDAP